MHTDLYMSWTSPIMSHQDERGKVSSRDRLHKQDIEKVNMEGLEMINPQADAIKKPGDLLCF